MPLPERSRAELIDGSIYMMAPPDRHQTIARELFFHIQSHIRAKGDAYEPFFAPFAVFLNADDKTYVEPDICIICDKDKLADKGCMGAPDWIIEIVSPASRRMDYFIKLFKYRTAGVREYWIVDPEKNRVLIYDFTYEDAKEYTFSDCIPCGIYNDLSIDFSILQGGI